MLKLSLSNRYISYCGLMVTTVIVFSVVEFFWSPSFLINSAFEIHMFPIFILAFTAPIFLSLVSSLVSFALRMVLIKPSLIIGFGQVLLDYIVPYLAPTFFVYLFLFFIWLFNPNKLKMYFGFVELLAAQKILFVEFVIITTFITIYSVRSVAGALYFFSIAKHGHQGFTQWEYGFISNFWGIIGFFTFNIFLFQPLIRLIHIFKTKEYGY